MLSIAWVAAGYAALTNMLRWWYGIDVVWDRCGMGSMWYGIDVVWDRGRYEIGQSKSFRTCECPSFYPLPAPSPGFETEYARLNASGALPTHVHKTSCGGDWWQVNARAHAHPRTHARTHARTHTRTHASTRRWAPISRGGAASSASSMRRQAGTAYRFIAACRPGHVLASRARHARYPWLDEAY